MLQLLGYFDKVNTYVCKYTNMHVQQGGITHFHKHISFLTFVAICTYVGLNVFNNYP